MRTRAVLRIALFSIALSPLACDEPVRPKQFVAQVQLLTGTLGVGYEQDVELIVTDSDGNPVDGVGVRVQLPPNGGSLRWTPNVTELGGYSRFTWNTPDAMGVYRIAVIADGWFHDTVSVMLGPGLVTRMELSKDSLHFSDQTPQWVRVRAWDKFGNEQDYRRLGITHSGLTLRTERDSMEIRPGSSGVAMGGMLRFYGFPTRHNGCIKVIIQAEPAPPDPRWDSLCR